VASRADHTTRADALSRLAWAVREWWVVAAACVLFAVTFVVVALAGLGSSARYEATAIVSARQLTIRPYQLPRFANAVFTSGAVAEAVSDASAGAIPAEDAVGDHVTLEPVLDTVALRVVGHAADAEQAARLADVAAQELVEQLRVAGPGVGTFAVQGPARVPSGPVGTGSVAVGGMAAAASGLALGVGAVGMLLVLRRPVLDGHDAATAAGAPLLATVLVPVEGSADDAPWHGVETLADAAPDRSATLALVGAGGDAHALSALCARLAQRRPGSAVVELPAATLDPPQVIDGPAATVLVVQEGEPASRVARLAARLGPDLLGVAFLARDTRRREVAVHERVALAGD
jgi:hypothetical protein